MILSLNDLDLTLRPRRKDEAGGEWDAWRSLPVRTRRRLTGARCAGVRGGYAPDQLAEALNDRYGMELDTCSAIELWAREVERLLVERRRLNTMSTRRNAAQGQPGPHDLLSPGVASPPARMLSFRAGGVMADFPQPEWEF